MSKSGQLLYYYHLLSQPSRVLKILLDVNRIPYTSKVVNLLQGEHLQEGFTKLTKFKRVPIINHNGVTLIESVAIARYLCREMNIADHWYPKDSLAQAKVDEFLEWQHIDLRYPCIMYFQTKFLRPLLTGKPPNQDRLDLYKKIMEIACNKIENLWLKDTPYLCGNTITIADLFGACELEQPRMAGYDPRNGRPKLNAWMARIENELKPHYTDAHSFVNGVVAKHKGIPPTSPSKL